MDSDQEADFLDETCGQTIERLIEETENICKMANSINIDFDTKDLDLYDTTPITAKTQEVKELLASLRLEECTTFGAFLRSFNTTLVVHEGFRVTGPLIPQPIPYLELFLLFPTMFNIEKLTRIEPANEQTNVSQ
jgi:hypothetical protein